MVATRIVGTSMPGVRITMTLSPRPVVLVIDPDALTLMGLSATLHHENLEVHGARTRTAALRAAQTLNLDLVVIDSWIEPDYGVSMVHAIRKIAHLVDVPVVFLTEPSEAKHIAFPTSSFNVSKPIDLEALVDVAKRAVWMPHLVHNHMTLRPHTFNTQPNSQMTNIS